MCEHVKYTYKKMNIYFVQSHFMIYRLNAKNKNDAKNIILSCLKNNDEIEKIVNAKNKHVCKYCHAEIVNDKNDDLLCSNCHELFGHKYFSQL